MSPQMACPGGCKVTQVAFVRFFSTVRCQMSPRPRTPPCLVQFMNGEQMSQNKGEQMSQEQVYYDRQEGSKFTTMNQSKR